MSINQQKKKIRVLELANKVRGYENANHLRALQDKSAQLSEWLDEENHLVNNLKEIESDLCKISPNHQSEFVHKQKLDFLVQADKKLNILSRVVDQVKDDIGQIKNELESSLRQKNVIEEKIVEHKKLISQMTDAKYMLDMS